MFAADHQRPDIDGLDEITVWTNREATNMRDIPSRVLLVGGSAAGVELGQFYARMGAQVTIVQRAATLIDREDPRVGELAAGELAADGVTIRTGRTPARARPGSDGGAVVTLDDGTEVQADVVIPGAGRRPRTAGLGLETAGVTPDGRGAIPVDDHCRAEEGLWAVGDVTGVALFTHVGMYQGRVVASDILGRDRAASYHGIPRVVFADPEIAATGYTTAQARDRGIDVAAAEIALADSIDPAVDLRTRPPRHAAPSGCSPTGTAASWSARGPSPRWPASGSTRPRSRSAPRSPSTPCSTRSPRTPPTPRPTWRPLEQLSL